MAFAQQSKQALQSFRCHDGTIVKGKKLKAALNAVADELIELAHAIYDADEYAAHVSAETKLEARDDMIARAELVRDGVIDNRTYWQRVNTQLTGKCVALLA
jgi:hypothetical protein